MGSGCRVSVLRLGGSPATARDALNRSAETPGAPLDPSSPSGPPVRAPHPPGLRVAAGPCSGAVIFEDVRVREGGRGCRLGLRRNRIRGAKRDPVAGGRNRPRRAQCDPVAGARPAFSGARTAFRAGNPSPGRGHHNTFRPSRFQGKSPGMNSGTTPRGGAGNPEGRTGDQFGSKFTSRRASAQCRGCFPRSAGRTSRACLWVHPSGCGS